MQQRQQQWRSSAVSIGAAAPSALAQQRRQHWRSSATSIGATTPSALVQQRHQHWRSNAVSIGAATPSALAQQRRQHWSSNAISIGAAAPSALEQQQHRQLSSQSGRRFFHVYIGVRANFHLGGQTEFCPNGERKLFAADQIRWGGSSRNFLCSPEADHIRWGGGVVAAIFRDLQGVVAELFPLAPITDPSFVLIKYVLCFSRIISTLCPN